MGTISSNIKQAWLVDDLLPLSSAKDKKQRSHGSTPPPPYACIRWDNFTFSLQINTEYFSEQQ